MRREFPAKVKVLAFNRAKGCCQKCGGKLYVGKTHYDHVVPDALGGEPTLENCEVLCVACHGEKTAKKDVPRIAKAVRQSYGHLGVKRGRSFGSFQTNRNGKFKKTFYHGTVPR